MRVLIFFLFIATTVVGQGKHNNEIVKFIESHIGQKVGGGVCYELFEGALRTYDTITPVDSVPRWTVTKQKYVIPGDVVLIDGIYSDGDAISHLAIVYKIEDGKIFIANQNVGVDDLDDSIVVIEDLSKVKKEFTQIKIEFVRVD